MKTLEILIVGLFAMLATLVSIPGIMIYWFSTGKLLHAPLEWFMDKYFK